MGKTTLLRIIAGLEAPDSGSVLFAGEDATAVDVRQPHDGVRERRLRPACEASLAASSRRPDPPQSARTADAGAAGLAGGPLSGATVGRPAPTRGDCPRAAARCAHPDPGRSAVVGRYRKRGADPAGAGPPDGGPHDADPGSPAGQRDRRRSQPGAGPGPCRGSRPACGAHGAARAVLPPDA
ncbi:hypothetical protein G6F40_014401 [Rhizopus arrhizus]|nr:hypothetical protein G6F40_014401 [Rhizopus arrhizus]